MTLKHLLIQPTLPIESYKDRNSAVSSVRININTLHDLSISVEEDMSSDGTPTTIILAKVTHSAATSGSGGTKTEEETPEDYAHLSTAGGDNALPSSDGNQAKDYFIRMGKGGRG